MERRTCWWTVREDVKNIHDFIKTTETQSLNEVRICGKLRYGHSSLRGRERLNFASSLFSRFAKSKRSLILAGFCVLLFIAL